MPEQRKTFHQELEQIGENIVRLAAMTTEFIPRGTEVLLSMDLRGAQSLIEDDDVLDELSIDIEDRCYHVLALQQPMAKDLRAIVTAIRLTSEIERSGDLMVNVAKGARRIYPIDFDPRVRGLIERMSEEAVRLYKVAIDAYVEQDASLAAALDDMDDELDAIHKDYIEAIFESHHASNLGLEAAVQLALDRALLRAHRRPCGQHRQPGRIHGDRLAARAQRRGPAPGQGGHAGTHRGVRCREPALAPCG